MENALVSVVIPIYNAENFLQECLNSILRQTYKNIEVIGINDGSQDNSLAILRENAILDSRIVVIDSSNHGVARARNLGLANARGEYVTFIDSDDFVSEDYCEALLQNIRTNDSDGCIYSCRYVQDKKGSWSEFKRSKTSNIVTKRTYTKNMFECNRLYV